MIIARLRRSIERYGGFKHVFKRHGILGLAGIIIDLAISYGISTFRDRLYKWTKDDYGQKECIFFPKGIGGYVRYSKVLRNLSG